MSDQAMSNRKSDKSKPFQGLQVEQLEERMMLSSVEIFAAGSEGGEQLALLIDGQQVSSWTVGSGADSGNFQTFVFDTPDTITPGQVRLQFSDSVFDPGSGTDQNLRVDAIAIDGVRFETEAPGVFSTGTWRPEDGIVPGFRQSEFLHADGFFQFAGEGQNSVTVRARGDEGGEQFRLIIGGSTVGTFTTTTAFQDFTYNTDSNVSLSDVRVEFFNDIFGNGVDTNLVVDSVTINGTTSQTEAASTFSTGTWRPEDGITPGFRFSETLHTAGFFDFGAGNSGGGGDQVIEIVARGDEGTENFRVLAGSTVLGEFNVSTGFQTYTITTDDYVPGTDLRIEFTNDVFDPANGIDTNLFVDRVIVNGQTRETEDPSTFGFGTWVDGFSEGYNQSEILNGNGFFLLDFSFDPDATSIGFESVGQFDGVVGGPDILSNPTSLQFGPDGRLYVSEQNGVINAFTIGIQNGEYVATSVEQIFQVFDIQNHNDDGSLSSVSNRQITGILVTGTAAVPVLYVSSSDPRISNNGDVNLDTNSGIVTRLTRSGNSWDAVDIIRGLPRSEENHANNGLVLSNDGSKLYVAVGGNTNNGAPSAFFSYTGEYVLSGTVLEIDLDDINSRQILTDNAPGQNGRQYIYDLPTLDDPTVENVTDGIGEDAQGLDESGPWGGNDGLNQAILPADAPLRIFADGFRNHYDLVLTTQGNLYTVDNGSNTGLGDDPVFSGGVATHQPNDGGQGDPEPLFLIEDGGYYGHPNPTRSNQTLAWTVFDDNGNPDSSLSVNFVSNLADLVPDSIAIADGFLIDPSKFTGDADRLLQSGIREKRDTSASNSIVNIGSSSNGLIQYNSDAFNGALNGDLLVAQFNGNVGRLDLNADGTDASFSTVDGLSGLSVPLDVTQGPNGTIWVGELGSDFIRVFAPQSSSTPGGGGTSTDIDGDGIPNTIDPFTRDANNGRDAILNPGGTLLWDFDANQDNNLPGPDGYGGGLTGVLVNGTTDFEEFFQQASDLPGQDLNLDNVKFITAAGGGTTVIEQVSSGDTFLGNNSGEFLFHTGATISPEVNSFTVEWTVFNPADDISENFQQIGGYLGTGDQSNYLKVVAINHPQGEIEIVLEDGDAVVSQTYIQANDLFDVPANSRIVIQLDVDVNAGTATPTVIYETATGNNTVSGSTIDLNGTEVLDAIRGQNTINGETTGLAIGLFSSNTGPTPQSNFQAIFDGIELRA